jgi:hypothetical protein
MFGNLNADAERRRALALRTVEVRIQQETSEQSSLSRSAEGDVHVETIKEEEEADRH